MATETRAVVQSEPGDRPQLQPVELPDPSAHEVLVELHATGVCQSQVYWMHRPRTDPVLFGHEGYGIVLAVGDAVRAVSPGAHVLVTWLPRSDADGRVPAAATARLGDGRTGRSPNVFTWAEHTVVDELYLYPLPPDARFAEAAVVGCAVITGAGSVRHAGITLEGGQVAIIGAGGVGLSAIAAARAGGAAQILALDRVADKLAFARKFGATHCIDVATCSNEQMRDLVDGGADLVIDCVATEQSLGQALALTRPGRLGETRGGVVSVVGLPKAPLTVDLPGLLFGQKTVLGSLAGGCTQADIATFLSWHHDGTLDLEALVTDRYPLTAVAKAVDDLVAGRVWGRPILLVR